MYVDVVDGLDFLCLLAAGALGGIINSVAGGGTFVTFPAAMLFGGVSGVVASATSSMALMPGAFAAVWAYRRELAGMRKVLMLLALPSMAGGVFGASLLISSEERVFTRIVPWTVLGATLLIVAKDVIWRRALLSQREPGWPRRILVALAVGAVAVYAGYFGAGKNIILLALLTLLQSMSIHQVNALKSAVVSMMTLVSSAFFLIQSAADLQVAAALGLGVVAGSYGGASVARQIRPLLVRYAVVAIGLTLTGTLAYQQWLA